MFKELESAARDQELGKEPEPGTPAPAVDCECSCAEPTPADGDEAPVGNRSLNQTGVHWVLNG